MCGIWGSPIFTPQVRQLLPFLALSNQERGTHAWGGSNGDEVIRHLGPIVNTWASEAERIRGWTGGIFHTRTASQGASTILENAHPFRYDKPDGSPIIGVHNGCLSNHTQLNTQYSRSCAVDSMHLWAHRAASLPWSDINGYANVAWYETRPGEEQALFLARINSTFLHCIRTEDGGLVFSSTLSSLTEATAICGVPVTSTYTLDENQVYRLGTDGVMYSTGERVPFRGTYTVDAATAARGGTGGGGSSFHNSYTSRSYGPGHCPKCYRETEDHWLLCPHCFEGHWKAFVPAAITSPTPLVILAAAAHAAGIGSSGGTSDATCTYTSEERVAAVLGIYPGEGDPLHLSGISDEDIEEVMRHAYGC